MSDDRVIIDNCTFEMLVAKVVLATKDHLDADASRSRGRLATLLTAGLTLFVAALTGVATFGLSSLKISLLDTTKTTIDANVPDAVRSALNDQLPILRASVEASAQELIDRSVHDQVKLANDAWNRVAMRAELRESIEQFDRNGGFTDPEMSRVISMIQSASSDSEIRGTDDFSKLLEKLIDHQFGAGRLDFFRDIEAEFKPEILNSAGMTMTMTIWFGRQIAYFPVIPKDLSDGKMKRDWSKLVDDYNIYAEASVRNRFPEVPLVYDLVLACMEGQSLAVTTALISRIDDLEDDEFKSVILIANEFSSENWSREKNGMTRLARERAANCATIQGDASGLSPRAHAMLATMISPTEEGPLEDLPKRSERMPDADL